jgi:hypothetical protein
MAKLKAISDEFKVITSSGGYRHNHYQTGSCGDAILKGVECPKCANQFMPTPFCVDAVCEKCGFSESEVNK